MTMTTSEELKALSDAATQVGTLTWEDTTDVEMDGTMMFSKGYDYDGLELLRWEAETAHGRYAIWPQHMREGSDWSAYGGIDGTYKQDLADEAEAKSFVQSIHDNAFANALVNAYRSGQLVHVDEVEKLRKALREIIHTVDAAKTFGTDMRETADIARAALGEQP